MAKLPDLTPEQLAKIQRLKGDDTATAEVSPEMYFIAEFGYYFGWGAIVALETGVIGINRAIDLMEAAQKVWYSHVHDQALATFYATKDAKTFNQGIKTFVKKSKVTE
jgi:hypothetical protein